MATGDLIEVDGVRGVETSSRWFLGQAATEVRLMRLTQSRGSRLIAPAGTAQATDAAADLLARANATGSTVGGNTAAREMAALTTHVRRARAADATIQLVNARAVTGEQATTLITSEGLTPDDLRAANNRRAASTAAAGTGNS